MKTPSLFKSPPAPAQRTLALAIAAAATHMEKTATKAKQENPGAASKAKQARAEDITKISDAAFAKARKGAPQPPNKAVLETTSDARGAVVKEKVTEKGTAGKARGAALDRAEKKAAVQPYHGFLSKFLGS